MNADLERDKKAADLGLSADITIDGQNVTMKLSANDAATVHSLAGQPILLEIENLSFQDKDLSASLVPKGDGIWQGKIPANMSQATWLARLIGPDWRISHRLENTTPTHIVLKP